MNNERNPKRNEVDQKYKWSIEDIYPSDNDWVSDLNKLKQMPGKLSSYRGRLGESAQSLLGFLKLSDEVSVLSDSLFNYAQRKSDEDTTVARYQAMVGQVMSVYVEMNSQASFETPEIIAIPQQTLDSFFEQLPELELYRLKLTRIRRKAEHILSEDEEKLLALADDVVNTPENIFSMFNDADLRFPDAYDKDANAHQVTHGSYGAIMKQSDRTLRKSAFESMYHTFDKFKNTMAATLSAQIKSVQFISKARKYPSSLHAALDQTEVPVEVYTNLIKTVHDNMQYMYDYIALRKKLMGVDELHYYDLYAELVPEVSDRITFEAAKETVLKALEPMGEEYLSVMRKGFEDRWCDVYENEGKTSGAYSAGARVHPFVLLNHKDTLDSMFTIAHEMGHAMHSYLSNKNQPVVYSDYVIFVAEVASTCNEALLMQYLLKTTSDKKKKAYLINYFLEQFRTTLYRQTMFAEFELKINNIVAAGETLTAEGLNEIYAGLNKLYYGDGIVPDDEIALEWARIPHFYYDYYVYQYATGYSAAIALSTRILTEGESAVRDYLGFLSGGCSKDPISLLKGAGVDMAASEPIEKALKMFGELIGTLEECFLAQAQ